MYLGSGDVIVESADILQKLRSLVESVIERLEECGISETQLQCEWSAITATSAEEQDFCLAAARLGLDPYAEAPKYETEILLASERLSDKELLRDFLDVVEPESITSTLEWVRHATSDIERIASPSGGGMAELRDALLPAPATAETAPWEIGWQQARQVRAAMKLKPTDPFHVETHVNRRFRAVESPALHAVGRASKDGASAIVLGQKQPITTKRFTIARALWHMLWTDDRTFFVTAAHTDRQKIERAFAAELLAPADGIAARFVDDSLDNAMEEPELEMLAKAFGVSSLLIQHQVENQVLPQRKD